MMKKFYIFFLVLLFIFSTAWLYSIRYDLAISFFDLSAKQIFIISVLYLASHFFRVVRLAILTLDDRKKILPLASAHIFTALPAFFLPFKLGEVIRLASFLIVFKDIKKSLAVWLVERLSDIIILNIAIIILYLAGISISFEMKILFTAFLVIAIFLLIGLYAISRTFIYLNRFLVLTSRSKRGMALLKISYAIWEFELTIKQVVKDRKSAIFLASSFVWISEILALSIYLQNEIGNLESYGRLFATSLFNNLGNQITNITISFGLYQSMLLAILTIFASVFIFIRQVVRWKTKND